MNNSKVIALSLLCLLSLPSRADVQSITVEADAISDGVKVGKRVIVSCRNQGTKRELWKKDNERLWCDINLERVCFIGKKMAAERVCNTSYMKQVALAENVKDDDVSKFRQELMDIKYQRLAISDKMLDLKKRELQLLKNTVSAQEPLIK